jgi:hypothetical protein
MLELSADEVNKIANQLERLKGEIISHMKSAGPANGSRSRCIRKRSL